MLYALEQYGNLMKCISQFTNIHMLFLNDTDTGMNCIFETYTIIQVYIHNTVLIVAVNIESGSPQKKIKLSMFM